MSLYKGSTLIAGGRQSMPLLSFMWADHKLNDVSWLRADTFSWQNGTVYKAAYQHLVDDINEISKWSLWKDDNNNSVFTKKIVPYVGEMTYTNSTFTTEVGVITATGLSNGQQTITVNNVVYTQSGTFSIEGEGSETIAGINVMVFVAKDGHKICLTLTHDESDIDAIYNATGVAWYYILDLGNQRFKLPRSKHNKYATTLGVAGNGMVLGLTNGINTYGTAQGYHGNDAMFGGNSDVAVQSPVSATSVGGSHYNLGGQIGVATDPANSGIIAQQEQDTDQYKYLYFYVGEFTQTALENTAGITAETLNDKVDKGHEVIAFQAPTAGNNYTWYRKYADGWVEQGGQIPSTTASSASKTVNLPITMTDTNYFACSNTGYAGNDAPNYGNVVKSKATTTITIGHLVNYTTNWMVCGMAAS